MKISKNPESGVYYATITTPHGTRTITTKATSREDAEQVVRDSKLKELELAAKAGRLTSQAIGMIVAGRKITVEGAIQEFEQWQRSLGRSPVSVANTLVFLNAWARDMKLNKLPPAAVTEQRINPWINDPKSESKASSRAVKLSSIRSFFAFCSAKGWTAGDPSRLVRVNFGLLTHAQKEPTEKLCFTDAEIKQLLDATELGTFWHSAIAIGRYTGLRLGDICQLQWDSLAKPGRIIVWTDKRDRRVELTISAPPLSAALKALERSDKTYCFPEPRQIILDPHRKSLFSVQFRRLCEKLDIEGKSFHCLRVTYATECMREGIEIKHISGRLGHVNESTTRGYIRGFAPPT